MFRPAAVVAIAIAVLGTLIACEEGPSPIRVESGDAATEQPAGTTGPATTTAVGSASPGASTTVTATATPIPFAATCGRAEWAARYDDNGRLRSPAAPGPPAPAGSVATKYDADLERVLQSVVEENADAFGVMVIDVNSGRYAGLNAERSFYAASLFKLTVMYEVFRQRELGTLAFTESLLYTPYYQKYDLGVAPMKVCSEVTVGRAVDAMIMVSENVSAVLLQDRTGANAINRDMTALGLTGTALEAAGVRTSARDMALLLELIARGRAVSAGASRDMLNLMMRQTVRNRIPAGVPAGVAVGNKTGDWEGATHDVAIVAAPFGTYVIAVLSDQGSAAPITALSRAVYRYFATGEMPPTPSATATSSATPTRTPTRTATPGR